MAMAKSDTLNYRGELFLVGQYRTPLLTIMGPRAQRSASFVFPCGQTWSLDAASQPSITEDASATTLTPSTTTRSEVYNTAQIFQETAQVSFKKQSQYGLMSGINTMDGNPVTDELTFQKMAKLRQIAIDMEYSFLQGSYQAATTSATAALTRGLIEATSTNAVAAGGAKLSKHFIDETLRAMAGNGALFADCAFLVNAYQKQALSDIYGYVPMDRNYGGLNIKQIETDFGIMSVIYTPQMSTSVVQIAELSALAPVFVPVSYSENTGISNNMTDGVDVLWQPMATNFAAYGGFFYLQCGLSYGTETYHGKITGLATTS
jgi:hypothetical protein